MKKIYLPREIFPLASVGAAGFMFLVQCVVLLSGAIIFQALPAPVEMLWFFPSVLLILVYALAFGILLSALNVYLRDVQYVTDVVMMLAMWGSPIVYSWTMVSEAFKTLGLPAWALEVYTNNPITLGVLGFRKAFWGAGTPADYPRRPPPADADRRNHRRGAAVHLAPGIHPPAGQFRAGDVMVLSPQPGPVVVRVEGVTKQFTVRKDNTLKERVVHAGRRGRTHKQEYVAVDGVDLEIQAGTTVGLLGPNGSGKSTLLKLIGGIVSPTEGRVMTRGRMAALLELGAGFHPDLSGRENVYLNASIMGMTRAETTERFDDILDFSGIGDFIDTQVKFYSSGMFVRLAFAVAVHTDPDVLLVDEVLAVGDEAFQRKCMERIAKFRKEGRTIVLVSHSAAQVQELCDRGIVLKDGKMVFDGNVNEAVSALRDVLEGRRVGEKPPPEPVKPIEVTRIEVLG